MFNLTNVIPKTKITALIALVVVLIGIFIPGQKLTALPAINPVAAENAEQAYAGLPLLFIENQGQANIDVPYYVQAQGQTVSLTKSGIVFDLATGDSERTVFSLNFINANNNVTINGGHKDAAVFNYLTGDDPADWKINLPAYREVVYHDIYPHVDLRLYGDNGALRYDFIVNPGADVNDIALAYQGIETLDIDNGELVATAQFGDSRQQKPYLYQEVNDQKIAIEGGFKLLGGNVYGFETGQYDTEKILVIDPVLSYSTYLGGSGDDTATSIAFGGPDGHTYVGGNTTSTNFPLSTGNPGVYLGGGSDAFIAEIDTAQTGAASLIYCTYFGGNGDDSVNGIYVTADGAVYLTGATTSTNLPVLNGIQVSAAAGENAFLTKLLPGGSSLAYSTYLGGNGNDASNGIIVDPANGIAYITGVTASTDGFPTWHAYQATPGGLQDAFVAGINPSLTGNASLIYSSYLGGSGTDISHSITMLSADWGVLLYIGGDTTSSLNFPLKGTKPDGTPHVMQDQFWGTQDGFVASFNPSSIGEASLYFSSYLGGGGLNSVTAVGICDTGCLYAIGWTDNAAFPMMILPYQSYQGGIDGFFVRIAPSGYTQYFSTFFGGTGDDYPNSVFSDYNTGSTLITGYTTSSNFPVKNATQTTLNGTRDAFVVRVNSFVMADPDNPLQPYANFMIYGSYLGGNGNDTGRGVTVDNHGGVLIAGETTSSNFPVQNPYQTNLQVARDAFVTRIGNVFASVTTGDATGITTTSARLNGDLIAQGTGWGAVTTQVSFEWGTNPGVYTHTTAAQTIPAPALGEFLADIPGLTAGNNYYFRAKVVGDGTTYGTEKTFTTSSDTTLSISVGLQGGNRPDAGWIIPLTVKFFTPGDDVLTATPVYLFNITTAKSGTAAVAQVIGVAAGSYDITVGSTHTLANVKLNVVITVDSTTLNMGTLLEGNANDDNIISILDFSILAASFGISLGDAGYDARADFDRSGQVNIVDFSLLASNFGKNTPVIVP